MPIGLLIYGWCAEEKTHWYALVPCTRTSVNNIRILPIMGTFVFGFGTAIVFVRTLERPF